VADDFEDARDGARVCGEGDERARVVGEDVVQKPAETCVALGVGLAPFGVPEGVGLREAVLEDVERVFRVDGGFG